MSIITYSTAISKKSEYNFLKIPELLEDLERKRFFVLRKSTNEYLTPILYCNTLFNDGSVHRVHASRVYIFASRVQFQY